jgi:hypothetical protein
MNNISVTCYCRTAQCSRLVVSMFNPYTSAFVLQCTFVLQCAFVLQCTFILQCTFPLEPLLYMSVSNLSPFLYILNFIF